MHLIKGNLGPGCLNLPHAFVLSGWLLGSTLLIVIAIQGIYSMYLLAYCKDLLRDKHAHTFMDVAHEALGTKGQRVVQMFLFVLQGGVCSVFLSLIATNLAAQTGLSMTLCIAMVTFALLGIVLQRALKDLRWLSTTANALMLTAILTAAIAGILEILQNPDLPQANQRRGTSNMGDIATFVSSMFFSFEGIGLVLPVENSFTKGYATVQEASHANVHYRSRVLVGAMSIVATLFLLIGVTASLGFPDIVSGSITAYLEARYHDNAWFGIVNALVIVAVFLTFPLQLTPAMEVLDEWLAPGCRPTTMCYSSSNDNDESDNNDEGGRGNDGLMVVIQRVDSTDHHRADALLDTDNNNDDEEDEDLGIVVETSTFTSTSILSWFFAGREWILRRYLFVLGCTLVVLLVDDLGLLMSLFGAVGQTGLALLPCVIHRTLQAQGVAPKHRLKSILDVITISFSVVVMISGLAFSIQRIYQE
jgi:amino acid permease